MALLKKMGQNADEQWSDDCIPESTPMRDYYREKVICKCENSEFRKCKTELHFIFCSFDRRHRILRSNLCREIIAVS